MAGSLDIDSHQQATTVAAHAGAASTAGGAGGGDAVGAEAAVGVAGRTFSPDTTVAEQEATVTGVAEQAQSTEKAEATRNSGENQRPTASTASSAE
ncbi:MAG: hypothetical protein ABI253_04010 [Mycobacterium sp.]